MFLERQTVSRKTSRDGKLEITERAAQELAIIGKRLQVEWAGRRARASLSTMSCTCRGSDSLHEHSFVQSEMLKSLPAGSEVDIRIDTSAGLLTVTPKAGR